MRILNSGPSSSVNDFQTTFSVICFVGFSFVTFIILGYALIATSIDIYNKAVTFRSENSAYGDRSRLASNFIVRFFSNPIERVMRFIVDIDGIHLDGCSMSFKEDAHAFGGSHVV
jgi:hypothetical protein